MPRNCVYVERLIMRHTLYLFIICICIACTSDNADNRRATNVPYDDIVARCCTCIEPVVAFNKQLKILNENGEKEMVMRMMGQAQEQSNTAMQCCRRTMPLSTRLSLDPKIFTQTMRKNCPEAPAMLVEEIVVRIKN